MQTLDPLVYFKLKSRLLELTVQDHQTAAARQKAFTDLGLPPGQYVFDDNTTSVMRIEDMQLQPEPPAAVPPAAAAEERGPQPLDAPEIV